MGLGVSVLDWANKRAYDSAGSRDRIHPFTVVPSGQAFGHGSDRPGILMPPLGSNLARTFGLEDAPLQGLRLYVRHLS